MYCIFKGGKVHGLGITALLCHPVTVILSITDCPLVKNDATQGVPEAGPFVNPVFVPVFLSVLYIRSWQYQRFQRHPIDRGSQSPLIDPGHIVYILLHIGRLRDRNKWWASPLVNWSYSWSSILRLFLIMWFIGSWCTRNKWAPFPRAELSYFSNSAAAWVKQKEWEMLFIIPSAHCGNQKKKIQTDHRGEVWWWMCTLLPSFTSNRWTAVLGKEITLG